jgi:hypothetical protein
MADYKETDLIGKKYQRACRIVIENPLGEAPTVNFVEEEVTILSGDVKNHKLVGSMNYAVDQNEMVPMIDLETNLPTETVYPVGLAQWIIYSLYWKKVGERDNPVVPDPPAEPETPVEPDPPVEP